MIGFFRCVFHNKNKHALIFSNRFLLVFHKISPRDRLPLWLSWLSNRNPPSKWLQSPRGSWKRCRSHPFFCSENGFFIWTIEKKTPQTSIHHRYFHGSIRSSLKVIGMCWVFFPFQILWGTSSCAINEPWSSPKKDTIDFWFNCISSLPIAYHDRSSLSKAHAVMQDCSDNFLPLRSQRSRGFSIIFEAHLGDEFAQCLIHHGRGAVLDPGHLCVRFLSSF